MEFTTGQLKIIEAPLNTRTFLSGPAGSGKTAAGIERLKFLLQNEVPGHEILLLFPQRNLSIDYQEALNTTDIPGSSKPVFATYGGIAKRAMDLFWPLILEEFSAFSSKKPPVFLTLESSLYFLSRIVEPLIVDKGYFASITIQRNRLYSQILDNLNKSAVHGFSHTEIANRLRSSWIGDTSQGLVFEHAQNAANLFREYCYENNLLDFSLQVEVFTQSLELIPQILDHYQNQYNHLIYDNCEEDIPVCHDFISSAAPSLESALIIFDQDAGYRSFLGASPSTASQLSALCDIQTSFDYSFTSPDSLTGFNERLISSLNKDYIPRMGKDTDLDGAVSIIYHDSYPPMINSVVSRISSLIDSGTDPENIVILAPYLSDALRFMFSSELAKFGILTSTHRPSRPLRDEPVTHCLLTLAAIAHPQWDIHPSAHDLSVALLQIIAGLDLPRAVLLSRQAIKNQANPVNLAAFETMGSSMQERITFYYGSRYQELVDWLTEYTSRSPIPLDHFLICLFGEVLSQPGFSFHDDPSKSTITSQIIRSVQKFRMSAGEIEEFSPNELGIEYYRMVKTGVLANQYLQSWTQQSNEAVFLAPAFTFLLKNRPVDYQFWLDVGSRGWHERIYQPLTNPHILRRDWQMGSPWRDIEEHQLNIDNLTCLTTGLIRRCREGIILCLTDNDEHGFEQKGLLIQAINNSLNRWGDSK